MVKYGYLIITPSRGTSVPIDGRMYKTEGKARSTIRGLTKNNSLAQRKQVGYINMRVKRRPLYEREIEPMKRTKDFIYN